MKFSDLTLAELNELYYMATQNLEQAKSDAKQYGGWFKKKLPVAKRLVQVTQDELYKKVDEMQEAEAKAFSKWG